MTEKSATERELLKCSSDALATATRGISISAFAGKDPAKNKSASAGNTGRLRSKQEYPRSEKFRLSSEERDL